MARSAEELTRLLTTGGTDECLAFFAGMSEGERRKLAKTAEETFRDARRRRLIEVQPGTFEWNPVMTAAAIAVCASCSVSTLKSLGWQAIPGEDDLVRVFTDRRPNWLGQYAEFLLDQELPRWRAVRLLMKAGLCRKPQHDNYVLGMLHHFQGAAFYLGKDRVVLDTLLEEPDLLEDVWRLFELEGGGEFSLATHDKYRKQPADRWDHSLVELSRRGILSRERLLDASLDALDRGFAQFRVGWFSSFHELLEPTIDERIARTDTYLHLLASPIPPTVSFALKAIGLIDRQTPLESARLIEALRPVLIARQKTLVKSALKLLARVATRDPRAAGEVAEASADSLMHEAPDLQSAALDLIEKHGSPHQEAVRDAVMRHADAVAASLRNRVTFWLGTRATRGSESEHLPSPAVKVGLKSLNERAARIPSRWRELAGIDQALAVLEQGRVELTACRFDGAEIPRLDSERVIVPLENLDELIDVAAATIEAADDYDSIERVFDGISRLCDQYPADFAHRTGPLRKRCRQVLERWQLRPFETEQPLVQLLGVVLAWVCRDAEAYQSCLRSGGYNIVCTQLLAGEALGRRARALAERAAKGDARPLLSAPTHAGGWIAPLALAERIRRSPAIEKADDFDKVLALLRLAPDLRTEAFEQLKGVQGEFVTAVRYALGDTGIESVKPTWLGVAAARALSPWQDDLRFEPNGERLGPDAARAASADTKGGPLKLTPQPPLPKRIDPRMLSVLLWRSVSSERTYDQSTVATIRAEQSVWPAAQEAVFAAGVLRMADNLDWWEAQWENRTYLEPLLDPDVPLRPMARLLLVLGLAAKEPGESGLATDACVAAIGDGRLDAAALGEQMLALWPSGLIKLARWSQTLAQVARASSLHAEVVQAALDRSLRGTPQHAPKDLHALLVLFQELIHETGQPVSTDARAFLSQISGSGKGAKAARIILQYNSSRPRVHAAEIMHELAVARLTRAERWINRSLP